MITEPGIYDLVTGEPLTQGYAIQKDYFHGYAYETLEDAQDVIKEIQTGSMFRKQKLGVYYYQRLNIHNVMIVEVFPDISQMADKYFYNDDDFGCLLVFQLETGRMCQVDELVFSFPTDPLPAKAF